MKITAIILFLFSLLFFCGTFHYALIYIKPGVYPPKQIVKSRALSLAVAGSIILIFGIIVSYFT